MNVLGYICPRRRRARLEHRRAQELAQARIAELAQMPAPDELLKAPDMTRADRRRLTIRTRRPRKRRTGRWG